MVIFSQEDIISEVFELREQGLTDNLILEELKKKGYPPSEIGKAIEQADIPPGEADFSQTEPERLTAPARAGSRSSLPSEEGNVYERIEEIAESMIDEKWDELIGEVKKIIEWKNKVEEKQVRIDSELLKLKEDFRELHQGVLGKLDDYDLRMRDVGTDLKAVGMVFKETIPEFVENVKELKSIVKRK